MKFIDDQLNKITMYRLVLYFLLALWAVGAVFSALHILPFQIVEYLASGMFLVAICWVTNTIFAEVFEAPTNLESVYISGLILALVITPAKNFHDLFFLALAAGFTISSKFMIALGKKHMFNPVAMGLFLATMATQSAASWWVGSSSMVPFVLVGGVLVIRKIRRFDLIGCFVVMALGVILGASFLRGSSLLATFQEAVLYTPLLFFASVMITEPLTTPPTKKLQSVYGALVGFLFAPQVHFGPIYTTPETALLLGNIFSYVVSPKQKLILQLKEKLQLTPDIYDFIFTPSKPFVFTPGQYLEWTLGHRNPDSRGNRRYFTIASSPTESDLRIGIKFYDHASSYKRSMLEMQPGSTIVASQLAGDFTLPPPANNQKFAFIAGGIGVTPFRSMLKYLIDTNQRCDIVLFFANKIAADIVYKDVLDEAQAQLGIRTMYTLSDTTQVPAGWSGLVGRISAEMLMQQLPDYLERAFYLSGPHAMVTAYEEVLLSLKVPRHQIHIDFFPGFV